MPFPYQDSIEYEAEIDGSNYTFEIGYNLGDVWSPTEDAGYGVTDWAVVKVNGKANMLGDLWAELLDEELIHDAICEQEDIN